MTEMKTLPAKELKAREARDRFFGTVAALEERIEPAHLIGEAARGARSRAAELALNTARAARARPVMSAAIAGGISLLLVRRSLGRMILQKAGHQPRG